MTKCQNFPPYFTITISVPYFAPHYQNNFAYLSGSDILRYEYVDTYLMHTTLR